MKHEILYHLRDVTSMSIADLGHAVGMSEKSITDMEMGTRPVHYKLIRYYASKLNVNIKIMELLLWPQHHPTYAWFQSLFVSIMLKYFKFSKKLCDCVHIQEV